MAPSLNDVTALVTSLQKDFAKAISEKVAATTIDPPGELLQTDAVSDSRVDTVQDVTDPAVDIVSVPMANNPIAGLSSFSHHL